MVQRRGKDEKKIESILLMPVASFIHQARMQILQQTGVRGDTSNNGSIHLNDTQPRTNEEAMQTYQHRMYGEKAKSREQATVSKCSTTTQWNVSSYPVGENSKEEVARERWKRRAGFQ